MYWNCSVLFCSVLFSR